MVKQWVFNFCFVFFLIEYIGHHTFILDNWVSDKGKRLKHSAFNILLNVINDTRYLILKKLKVIILCSMMQILDMLDCGTMKK